LSELGLQMNAANELGNAKEGTGGTKKEVGILSEKRKRDMWVCRLPTTSKYLQP